MISFNQRVYKGVLLPIIFFSYNILISYSSVIASVYTRQGLIGIGKRSFYTTCTFAYQLNTSPTYHIDIFGVL